MPENQLIVLAKEMFPEFPEEAILKSITQNQGIFALDFDVLLKGKELHFRWEIPSKYPLARGRFVCEEYRNRPHCLDDGTVCVVPAFCPDPKDQLAEDLRCLQEWIEEFVINDKPALRYAYPEMPRIPIYMVFQEDKRQKKLKRGDCGEFKYCKMYDDLQLMTGVLPTAIAMDLGGKKIEWPSQYSTATKYKGLWLYIENEPRDGEGNLATVNKQLDSIFTIKVRKEIKRFREAANVFDNRIFTGFFPLMVGYQISDGAADEVHWDMILMPIYEEEVLGNFRKLLQNFGVDPSRYVEYSDSSILWGTTLNACYDRFFGRGKFSPKLCESRICIIGVGAIGGTLADMLVRGGCKNLAIVDYDRIQPGNVCRSVYPFLAINRMKTEYLATSLMAISPFVEVKTGHFLPFLNGTEPQAEIERAELEQYDIIFDCTATPQVAWTLDQLDVAAMVINLSITDKAKEILAVCESENILDRKEAALRTLGSKAQPSFYEGMGCWSPTFQANIAEINSLLAIAISKIDQAIGSGKLVETFALQRTDSFEIKSVAV